MKNTEKHEPCQLIVTGDIVIDHHIYRGSKGTRLIPQVGGAGQTAELLRLLAKTQELIAVHETTPSRPKDLHKTPGVRHSFATWAPFAFSKKEKKPKTWRVSEALGFDSLEHSKKSPAKKGKSSAPTSADVVVIDEGGLGFRNDRSKWPAALTDDTTGNMPWIVLKMSFPVCQGELWAHLMQKPYRDRLIVIVAADDLRRSGASVTKGLSWEKSVRELLSDLTFHADFHHIPQARHVVVNFGHDGALWIDNTDRSAPRRTLIFDPGHLEGNWEEDWDGTVLGAGACLPASLAWSLVETAPAKVISTNSLGTGIARGLAARRTLLESGHGPASADQPGFPYSSVVETVNGRRSGGFSMADIPDIALPLKPGTTGKSQPHWTIISGNPIRKNCALFGRAREVSFKGEAALNDIPFGRFGKLYTVDCNELDGFYGLRKLIMDYVGENNPGKPLSLGVFGPPGSGKSFGIKEISKGILGDGVPILTFNLSQFKDSTMLIGALHQVRDEVLKGNVPIVFWDEFDSNNNKWLQYMLAPMNDGEFLEGQVTHPIGKCIFIFAGGTATSLNDFSTQDTEEEKDHFRLAKGPDFISRLKGYLNVLGPNPRTTSKGVDPTDVGYPIRRAIMLRVHAGCFGSDTMTIDPGLLDAMLKISKFKHGARSIATIVNLTTGGSKRALLRCNLPPREQLGLHVDYDEFMALVEESTMFRLKSELLAPHIHQFYLDLAKEKGWEVKYPMAYDELPDPIKKDNIAAAKRLPNVLSLVGLMVVDSETKDGLDPVENAKLVMEIIKRNIELLGEAEHDGWMESKLINNWIFKEKRDDDKKHHPCLKPFKDLHESEKDKDRNAVKYYPEIVEKAGFVIRFEKCYDESTEEL